MQYESQWAPPRVYLGYRSVTNPRVLSAPVEATSFGWIVGNAPANDSGRRKNLTATIVSEDILHGFLFHFKIDLTRPNWGILGSPPDTVNLIHGRHAGSDAEKVPSKCQ